MLVPFDILKTMQGAAVLLKFEPSHAMSRLRLLKLLYIADRELLQTRMRPLTGDRPVAMRNGPVLSQTYDLIKGVDFGSPQWNTCLRSEVRNVHLIDDPGVGKLSRQEIQKLQEVSSRFAERDDWEVAEYTHGYPEWIKNQPDKTSYKAIPLDDLLEAIGLVIHKAELLANEKAEIAMERLLA